MKKKLKILTIIFIIFTLFITNVEASSPPYKWKVNGEELWWDTSNKSNTAKFSSIQENGYIKSGKLTLDNYNGGQLELECYGSAMDISFVIELIGDNYITVKDGIGIIAPGISFIGTGSLIIEAIYPFNDLNETVYGVTNKFKLISPNNDNLADTTDEIVDDEKDINSNVEKSEEIDLVTTTSNNTYLIISIVLGSLCVILFVALLVLAQKKKNY